MPPDIQHAIGYALGRLAHELDSRLYYHGIDHTRDDVVPAAERLAGLLGVCGEPLLLLRTAAYFHDLGFIEQREGHEEVSMRIARGVLPGFGYSASQVAQIEGMILATRLPQTPHTLLEQVIADADLDSLGREDFLTRNAGLRAELAAFGAQFDDTTWLQSQLHFLESHRYWTEAARILRNPYKHQNILTLHVRLARLAGA